MNWLINTTPHVLTAIIRKKRFVSSQCFSHQKNKHRGLGFVQCGFQCHNFALFLSFYFNGFYCAFKTTKRGIKSVFDGFIFCFMALIHQEGEGWWWKAGIPVIPARHATTPWTAITGAQLKLWTRVFQAAASGSLASGTGMDHTGVAPGFVMWEKGWGTVWVSLSLSQSCLPLREHERPCPKPTAGGLHLPLLPPASCSHQMRAFPNFWSRNLCPTSHISHPHSRMTKRDEKGCTSVFKDEHQDAALAKTCLMFIIAVFLWIFS